MAVQVNHEQYDEQGQGFMGGKRGRFGTRERRRRARLVLAGERPRGVFPFAVPLVGA